MKNNITNTYNASLARMREALTPPKCRDIASLKKSAAGFLRGLQRNARKAGWDIDLDTLMRGRARIEEMDSVEFYRDFIKDTMGLYDSLLRAIERGRNCYFYKI